MILKSILMILSRIFVILGGNFVILMMLGGFFVILDRIFAILAELCFFGGFVRMSGPVVIMVFFLSFVCFFATSTVLTSKHKLITKFGGLQKSIQTMPRWQVASSFFNFPKFESHFL